MLSYLSGFKQALTSLAALGVGIGWAMEAGGLPVGNEVAKASTVFLGYVAQDAHRAAQKEDLPQQLPPVQ